MLVTGFRHSFFLIMYSLRFIFYLFIFWLSSSSSSMVWDGFSRCPQNCVLSSSPEWEVCANMGFQ